jgi:hypothetical protein
LTVRCDASTSAKIRRSAKGKAVAGERKCANAARTGYVVLSRSNSVAAG